MGKIHFNGHTIKVPDEMLALPPEQLDAEVEAIIRAEGLAGDGGRTVPHHFDAHVPGFDAETGEPLKGGTVMGRDIPHTGGQEMQSYDPSFLERMGQRSYDLLKSAGFPADQMRRHNNQLDNAVRGAAHVATAGASDELVAAINAAMGGDYRSELEKQRAIDEAGGAARTVGQVIGGAGMGLGLAKAGLSPAYNLAKEGAGFLPVMASSAVEGALASGLFAFGDAEGGLGNRFDNAMMGAAGGGIIGATVPAAVRSASAIKNWIAPAKKVSPELTKQAAKLEERGIPLTAGQKTGNENLRRYEASLGGNRTANLVDDQKEAFTASALDSFTDGARLATPEVIDAARERIGQQFRALANRNRLEPDQQFNVGLARVVIEYERRTNPSKVVPAVRQYATEIFQASRQGLDGDVFQSIRSRIGSDARHASQDPELFNAYLSLNETLDDAMERTIARNNPDDLGLWKEARQQYRNYLVGEQAATAKGADAARGIISPSTLHDATVSVQGRRNYATGGSDLADLARAGEAAMTPMPQGNGTAPFISKIPGAKTVAGNLLMSKPAQGYLSKTPESRKALVEALMRSGALPEGREVPRVFIGR